MKILICDDEYSARLIVRAYLDMYHVEIIEASTGKEALSIIESEKPDILIVDYSMPRMNGLEVLKKLKVKIPAVMITSEGFSEEVEKEIREYVCAYLVKPINPEILVDMIEQATGKRLRDGK